MGKLGRVLEAARMRQLLIVPAPLFAGLLSSAGPALADDKAMNDQVRPAQRDFLVFSRRNICPPAARRIRPNPET